MRTPWSWSWTSMHDWKTPGCCNAKRLGSRKPLEFDEIPTSTTPTLTIRKGTRGSADAWPPAEATARNRADQNGK